MSAREIHGSSSTKKSSRQNSAQQSQQSITSQLNRSLNQQQQQILKLEQEEVVPSFYNEIYDIMRGFGDCCNHPLRDSVLLVEKIVQQQLKGILNDVIEISLRRKGTPNPTQTDFEFLMRKHPIRVNRMRKHIKDIKLLRRILKMQQSQRVSQLQAAIDDADGNQDSDEDADAEYMPEKYDEEKTRRLFRADRISQVLSGIQYQEFNDARRTSFYCRQSEKMKHKFRGFLSIPNDLILSNGCMNILAYLAHETIATIVDFAILTRLNSENRVTDPFTRISSWSITYGMFHLCPEVTQGRGLDGVKPITVQEIQEAIRRFNQYTRRGIGFYRNTFDYDVKKAYLAV